MDFESAHPTRPALRNEGAAAGFFMPAENLMGVIKLDGLPLQQPEAEPWPIDEHTIRVDEMFARQLDTEFATGVRGLLHDPHTGISAQSGEAALKAIAGAMPALDELKKRTLAQAIGPRQRSVVERLIDTRLDWAAGTLGQLAQRATMQVDDASVAERIAGLNQDAATAWQDPAHLRKLGRSAVEELRYQGERRGRDPAETDTCVRRGLSDLYAGAVETAIGRDDLDGAAKLYDHARPVIDVERQAAVDRRFVRARETALYRDVDRDMAGIPIDPAGPPVAEVFAQRAAELTPEDASDEVRAGIGQVADFAQHRAERQWNKQQAEAGVAVFDWLGKNPDESLLAIPSDIRDWLAPDQWDGLVDAATNGWVRTDAAVFERLDWLLVYEPDNFAAVDLDRHRLSLDDEDHTRFADARKAIAEGRVSPDLARYDRLRRGIDRALTTLGVDTDGPAAAEVRAEARGQLEGFETIEGRAPVGADLDEIARRAVDAVPILPSRDEVVAEESTSPNPTEAAPTTPTAPEVTRFDDGTKLVTRHGVDTERGKADVTEAYDEQDRIVSTDATFADGHRVESRWSYPTEGHWSQVDTVRDPEGETLGTVTTTFDGERVTRTAEPVDGPSQTEVWDKDGPVATAQTVAAPVLAPAIAYLLELTAAAIGVLIVKRGIEDATGQSGSSEMARPSDGKPGEGNGRPPESGNQQTPDPNAAPPPPPRLPSSWKYGPLAHVLIDWLTRRDSRIDRDQYDGADGVETAAGVRLDPRVGDPAAGRDYLPDNENHRKGLRGEYGLANDIAGHFPDHTVIDFGRKAGERGPDVISVDRNGEVHFWDSKWRGSDTSIGPGGRAHQTGNSFQEARAQARARIEAAMEIGRLSPEAGNKALENVKNGNLTIVTVGTGSASNGVVERIVGDERAVVHPERRP